MAGLGLALVVVLKGDIRDRALEDARQQAEHMAVAVAVDLLTSQELQAGLDLRTLAAMDEAIEGHRIAGEIVTAKLFDGDGRLAYSPERDQIGEDGGDHVRHALDGHVLGELESEESEHERGAGIVRSAIDRGHHLGLEVVAEGVETVGTLGELRALLLRTLPAEDPTGWLRERAEVV